MPQSSSLATLAERLVARREQILRDWRAAVVADATLSTPVSLSRAQFRDHVPRLLDDFIGRLANGGTAPDASAARDHGSHRWHHGYSLNEVVREWGHLQLTVVQSLEDCAMAPPTLDAATLAQARLALTRLCVAAVNDSVSEFERMQRAEAAGQIQELAQGLERAREIERRQNELLRAAAHDLRGSLGIVTNAAAVLGRPTVADTDRDRMLASLHKALGAQQTLLNDLMDLARLQAGQEKCTVAAFDAARVLTGLCEAARPMAQARSLYLRDSGPHSLPVEGDVAKVQRIVQNLLLNAIGSTRAGGVTVAWGDSRDNDPRHWMLVVADTGPGLDEGAAKLLKSALRQATDDAREVEDGTGGALASPPAAEAAGPATQREPEDNGMRREGIGLSIVKRLCELLDASLELETRPGRGTVFRVLFPRRYGPAD